MIDAHAAATTSTGFNVTVAASIVAACSASFVAILNAINARRTTSYAQLLRDLKELFREVTRDELEDLEKAIDRLTEAVERRRR